jgi:hypothetical protein
MPTRARRRDEFAPRLVAVIRFVRETVSTRDRVRIRAMRTYCASGQQVDVYGRFPIGRMFMRNTFGGGVRRANDKSPRGGLAAKRFENAGGIDRRRHIMDPQNVCGPAGDAKARRRQGAGQPLFDRAACDPPQEALARNPEQDRPADRQEPIQMREQ